MVTPEILIIGAYPPPYGGVTMHILRLMGAMRERGIGFHILNLTSQSMDVPEVTAFKRKPWKCLRWLLSRDVKTYVVMNRRPVIWALVVLLSIVLRKRSVIRLQRADILDWKKSSKLRWFWIRWVLRSASAVICVNQKLANALLSAGIPQRRILVRPGFLPPQADELDPSKLSSELTAFANCHSPIIAANGRIARYNSEDLYGLDLLVELGGHVKATYPNFGLIIAFWEFTDEDGDYLRVLKDRVEQFGIGENVIFELHKGLFVPILGMSDIFIRPTNTDGDANSIRESLHLRIPAIASDVIQRPGGTLLFENRNQHSLNRVVISALRQLSSRGETNDQWNSDELVSVDNYIAFIRGTTSNN